MVDTCENTCPGRLSLLRGTDTLSEGNGKEEEYMNTGKTGGDPMLFSIKYEGICLVEGEDLS